MLNVAITYNPYFVETSIKIDGEVIPETSQLCEMCRHERLQNWIDKFLDALYRERREKKAVIDFQGAEFDAEDVKSAIQDYNDRNPGHNFSIGKIESGTPQQQRIDVLKKLFEEGKQGPFSSTFQSDEMQAAFDRALDPAFEVYVVATMSSGKSTVLNALVGMELLPAKNQATTAKIARIMDDDNAPFFTAQRFNKEGKPLSEKEKAGIELLEKWNDDPQTSRIEISGNIPMVQQTEECRMVFVDTPGPNSNNDAHHQVTTEAICKKPLSMVLYILNATNLSVQDDETLLRKICDEMKKGGRKAQDRFIFVINKIDAFDPQKGESVDKALDETRKYLQEAGGIEKPLLIPVSAQFAKLLRVQRGGGELTRSEKGDYAKFLELFVEEPDMNMVKHVKSRLGGGCVRRLEERIAKAKSKEDLAEIYSGIPILEELLNDFLQKHALPARLKDAVDTFDRVMHDAKIAEGMNKQLGQDDAAIQEAVEKIERFQKDATQIETAKKFREKVSDTVYDLSPQVSNTIKELLKKTESLCSELTEKLSDSQVTPKEARWAIETATEKCKSFDDKVLDTLKESLKVEYVAVMDDLRKKYQEHVEHILNKTFPEDSDLREFQAVVMEMPSVSELINANTETVEEIDHYVTEGIFENWNWLKFNWTEESRTHAVYEDVDYVNLVEVAEEIASGLRSRITENIESFKKQAREHVETAKKSVLKAMEAIDRKVEEVKSQLLKAQTDRSEKEALRKENQKKLDWFNNFEKKLHDILSV